LCWLRPIASGRASSSLYSSVHCVRTLRHLGYEVVIINNNPETVSTDFDTSDRLYFEPLSDEDVMNVIKAEHPVASWWRSAGRPPSASRNS
jgi:carbamoyl-phosphate synthase large subunit